MVFGILMKPFVDIYSTDIIYDSRNTFFLRTDSSHFILVRLEFFFLYGGVYRVIVNAGVFSGFLEVHRIDTTL